MNIQFTLPQAVPFLNTTATNVRFFMWYPEGKIFWDLMNDDLLILRSGNYVIPQAVLDTWTSDQDLIDDIVQAAPWNI